MKQPCALGQGLISAGAPGRRMLCLGDPLFTEKTADIFTFCASMIHNMLCSGFVSKDLI